MRPSVKIVEIDGTEIEREMNDAEYEVFLKDMELFEQRKLAAQEQQTARAALLERLGITEDEAKLLLT
jgi:hypothetical protein